MIDRNSVEGRLHEIAVPTLVLRGDEDQVRTKMESEMLSAGIPNARREIGEVKGAGHMVSVEDPAWVASQVSGFLLNLPP